MIIKNFKGDVIMSKMPKVIGNYSPVCVIENFAFTSGQLPINPETNKIDGEGIVDQTRQAMNNLKTVLESEGFLLEDVLKTTVFLKDITDSSEFNTVYGTFFKKDFPARSAIEVGALPQGALLEIEAIAYKK